MNPKIIGESRFGNYKNTGSCRAAVTYNLHELKERPDLYLDLGVPKDALQFFDMDGKVVTPEDVMRNIDALHSHLGRNDAKFYSVILSPSDAEIRALGSTPAERLENGKRYVYEVMDAYARSFGRTEIVNRHNLVAYAIPHILKGKRGKEQLHWHIIIARKDRTNRYKLSPLTHHRSTTSGPVQGGFDIVSFDEQCESIFDQMFVYKREVKEQFKACLAKKKSRKTTAPLPSLLDFSAIRTSLSRRKQRLTQKEEVEFLQGQLSAARLVVGSAYQAYEQAKGISNIYQQDINKAFRLYNAESQKYLALCRTAKSIERESELLVRELIWISPLIGAAIGLLLAISVAIYQAIVEIEKASIQAEIEKSLQAINELKADRIQAIAIKQEKLSDYLAAKSDYREAKEGWRQSLEKASKYLAARILWREDESRILLIPSEGYQLQRWSYKQARWVTVKRNLSSISVLQTKSGNVSFCIKTKDGTRSKVNAYGKELTKGMPPESTPLKSQKKSKQ